LFRQGGESMPTGRGPKRASGRWDPALEGAILDATLAAVAELGYDRMTMDELAARAGVGKAAIYRRWSSKGEVVAQAIAHWRRSLGRAPSSDTGSLSGDLDALVEAIPDYDADDVNMFRVVMGVATAAMRDPALSAALDDLVLSVPRQVLRSVLDRAVSRGEISTERDLSLLPDAVLGLNLLRMISGRPLDRIYVRRVLDDVVLPLATAHQP
jgi:AcrR family transcriptional regulator